jgi:hypothetical protein
MAIDDFRTQAAAVRGLLGDLGVTDEDYINAKKARVKAAQDSVEADLAGSLLEAPKHYTTKIKDEKGTFGLLKDAFFGEMKGPLAAMFAPEYVEAKQNYATDLKAYAAAEAERQKLGVMDPQVEAYARILDEIDPVKAAYVRASNSVKEFDGNDYTLSEGQKRMSGFDDSLLAEGNEKDLRTAAMRERDDIGDKMGITDPRALGSLLGVLTEPTITTQLSDGTTLHSNAITPWLEQWAAGKVNGQNGATTVPGGDPTVAGGGSSTPGLSSSGVTPEAAAEATTRAEVNKATAEEIAAAPGSIRSADKILANLNRIGGRQLVPDENGNESYRFVAGEGVEDLYGSVDAFMPDALRLRSAENNKLAEIEMLLGSLSIEERDKLKGSGTITDSEQAKLDSSISALSRGSKGEGFLSNVFGGFGQGKISDEMVNEHLNIIYDVMENARDRAAGLAPSNFQTEGASDYTQRKNFTGMSSESFDRELFSGRLKPGNIYITPTGEKRRYEVTEDGKPLLVKVEQ